MSDNGAANLASALPRCPALRELWLGSAITDEGAEKLALSLRDPKTRLKRLALGGIMRGGLPLINLKLGAGATEAFAEAFRERPSGPLETLRLSGCEGIGGEACINLVRRPHPLPPPWHHQPPPAPPPPPPTPPTRRRPRPLEQVASLAACATLTRLHIDGCGLTREHTPRLLDAVQSAVWCLHEVWRARTRRPPRPARSRAISRAPRGTPPSPHNTPTSQLRVEYDATGKRRYSTAEGEEGRVLTLQQRLSLAKILEDNRSMGRRRVDSWRLSRSLEEARTHPLLHRAAAPTCAAQPPLHLPRALQVAWVFNHYCANIRSETVDAGLEAWGGPDCAQFIRNVGLPQYDICFEGNMTGAKVRTRQAPSSPAEPLRPRRTGRHLQPWVMSGSETSPSALAPSRVRADAVADDVAARAAGRHFLRPPEGRDEGGAAPAARLCAAPPVPTSEAPD